MKDRRCPFADKPFAELTRDERVSLEFWDDARASFRNDARELAEPKDGTLSDAAIDSVGAWFASGYVNDEYESMHVEDLLSIYRSRGAFKLKFASSAAFAAALVAAGALQAGDCFHVREADDLGLVSGDAHPDSEPREWIVPGMIPRGCNVMFVAKSGALKTTTATALSVAVAHGRPWLGRPTNRCKVAYFNWDSPPFDVDCLLKGMGADGKVQVSHYPAHDLSSNRFWSALEKVNPALAVMDSITRGNPDVDEKDSRFARPLLRAAEFSARFGTTFLWIAHCPKDVRGDDLNDWIRGTSAQGPALDVAFGFRKISEKKDPRETIVSVHCLKMRPRGIEKPTPFRLRMTNDGLELAKAVEAKEAKAEPTDDELVLAVVKATPGITSDGIADAVDIRATDTRAARRRLEAAGAILNRGSARSQSWFAT